MSIPGPADEQVLTCGQETGEEHTHGVGMLRHGADLHNAGAHPYGGLLSGDAGRTDAGSRRIEA